MASVHNYTFNNVPNGNDECGVSARDMQIIIIMHIPLLIFFSHWGGMKKTIDLATSLPNVNFTGGHGSVNGEISKKNQNLN